MLEVQLEYLIDFAQFLRQFALYFAFGITFVKNIFLFLGRVPS